MPLSHHEQQSAYLQAMGIQAWTLRDAPVDAQTRVPEPLPMAVEEEALLVVSQSQQAAPESLPAVSSPPPMDEEPPLPTDDFIPSLDMPGMETPSVAVCDVSHLDWPELRTAVSTCTACDLHSTRTQTVFGVGDPNAEWMIIGEAPGADEDQQGEPFVGRAGQLLNNMLKALGLQREQVFIANILKCRPPENRNPRPEEVAQCEAFLQRQVALVKPKIILAVGGVAAHNLLKVDTPVSRLRGQVHHYDNVPLVVTYHPAYLLRKPTEKAKSWVDLKFAAAVVKGEQP